MDEEIQRKQQKFEDGLSKVQEGLTTIDEIMRVTKE